MAAAGTLCAASRIGSSNRTAKKYFEFVPRPLVWLLKRKGERRKDFTSRSTLSTSNFVLIGFDGETRVQHGTSTLFKNGDGVSHVS